MTAQVVIDAFRNVRGDVTRAVQNASSRSGVNFSYLMAQAAVESGYRPDAKAGSSSAEGLYQFLKGTWLNVVRDHGAKHGLGEYSRALEKGTVDPKTEQAILALRRDPTMSALLAAEHARDNKTRLEQSVGGRVGDTDLYLAHFLGANGAEKFLKNLRADPGRGAAELFPDAAQANRAVFYEQGRARSLGEVRSFLANKLDDAAKQTQTASTKGPIFVSEGARPRNAVPEVMWLNDPGLGRPKFAASAEMLLLTLSEVENKKSIL